MKKIIIVDDNSDVLLSLKLLLKKTYTCYLCRFPEEAKHLLEKENVQLIMQDMNFKLDTTSGVEGLKLLSEIKKSHPEIPVILFSAWANIDVIVEGMKRGADNFFIKPWDNSKLLKLIDDAITLNPIKKLPEIQSKEQSEFPQIIGQSKELREQLAMARKAAASDVHILIRGENGTGKDLLAKEIHRLSARRDGPFVKVNIGGLNQNLFDSELFGHEKGAFTDAKTARIGRLEEAEGGSIFLDEIGDLSLEMQVKLLRVIQDGQFERLGSNSIHTSNLRFITATNKNLERMIEEKTFREDLYYRINTIELKLPSLKERLEDIFPLAHHFLDKLNKKYQRNYHFTDEQINQLQAYDWPGNIRQLEHHIERSVLLSANDLEIDLSFLKDTRTNLSHLNQLEIKEKEELIKALKSNEMNISHTAKKLGISRNALYRRIEKYQIKIV